MIKLLLNIALLVGLGLNMGSPAPAVAQAPAPPRRVVLDVSALRQQLAPAPGGSARRGPAPTFRLRLPTLRGPRSFVLTESFVLPADDAAARQRIRTFTGAEEGAPGHRVSVELTPRALTAQVLAGAESASLRPAADGSGAYLLQATPPNTGPCATLEPVGGLARSTAASLPAPFSFGTQLRRIRYAILVTQEYYAANGNTDASVEQAVVAAMNQMTALYSQELSVGFTLVKPTGGTYYFSAVSTATLPGSDPAAPGRLREQNLGDVAGFIGSRFDASTYDLGHCFHNSGGGVAYVGIICESNLTYRAGAWSGVGTSGFRQVLAHEMGHQHGAAHTFTGPCGSGSPGSNLEPGGGATIMAYTYVCGAQTLQGVGPTDEDHFNTHSLRQMRDELLSVSCPTVSANANRPPTLNAGADYVIPRNTPFTLTATGSDPDGDALAYTWNQFDYTTNLNALGSIVGTGGLAAVDDPEAPLFRPRPPRSTPSRTFPDLQYVLANSNRPADRIGEALPNVGRSLNFVVTARDQVSTGGTFATDNVTLTVAPNTGPFAVTTQNDPALWIAGQPATVTWAVNGTDQAPIGVSQVRITLSTDGGQTFGAVLAASTSNDGSEVVAIPNVTTAQARVRVEAVGNIFFDINDVDFPIGPCAPAASQILPATSLTANAGDAALNLDQNAFSLTELTGANQLAGAITATDATTFLTDYDGSSCARYSGNPSYYDSYVFVPSTTGSYTINTPTGFGNMVIRVYSGAVFTPGDPCQNILVDNVVSGFLPRSVTVPLTAGQPYTLVLSSFGGSPLSAPANGSYSVTFSTSPAGGTAYAPLQSAGYEYQYVVVNTATNTVVRIAPTADLRTLPGGTYDVYGLLFQRNYDVSGLQSSSFGSLQATLAAVAPCGQLSGNARRVTVVGGPLPVTLTSFTATAAGDCSARLTWATATETNSARYEVERSTDGQAFTRLAAVPSHNRATGSSYSYLDQRAAAPLRYYRLRMVDTDGTTTYSPVATLAAACSAPAPLTLAPNPTAGRIELGGLQAGQRLRIYSSAGRLTYAGTATAATQVLDVQGWATGLYLVQVQQADGASAGSLKFIKE